MVGDGGCLGAGGEPVILARRLVELSRVEAEALIRFAVELLCRAKYAPAIPDGLEEAYVETLAIRSGSDAVNVFLQDLGERVHDALGETFETWAGRVVLVEQDGPREIADLASQLVRLNPARDTAEYHRVFGELVALEQKRRQAAGLGGDVGEGG
jgi:hypothetical protein